MTRLSGRVPETGTAISGATVAIIDTQGNEDPTTWSVVASATTDANGEWSVSGLSASAVERYHAVAQYDSGTEFVNFESLPYLSTPADAFAPRTAVNMNTPTASVSVGSAIPDSGGTHQWNHDEASGSTLNDSIGSLDGTINGATWQTDAGAAGAYLDYDGVDDRTLITGGASEFTHFTNGGTGTLFAWVNFGSLATYNPVFASTFTNNDVGIVLTPQNGSDIRTAFFYGNGTSTDVTGTWPTSTGVWTPVAFVADGSNLTLYAGDPLNNIASEAILQSTSSNWSRDPYFGWDPVTGNYADVSIDIPWIDSAARSQSNLQSFVDDTRQLYP